MKEPETREEWQFVVNLAAAMRLLASTHAYGLTTGGPTINEARIADLIERGGELGITPQEDLLTDICAQYVREWNADHHEKRVRGGNGGAP